MDSATTSAPPGKPIKAHSCQSCALRKVKCDKQKPCSACTRHNVECEYRSLPPPRRKRKSNREEALLGRLEQYERLLQQKGVDPGSLPSAHGYQSSSITTNNTSGMTPKDTPLLVPDPSTTQPEPLEATQSSLVHDQNRSNYLDNGLWTRVVKELAEPADALGHSSDEEAGEDDAGQDSIDFVLGLTPMSISAKNLHPAGEQVLELWHIFLENVDPLTKVVHGPSLQPAVQTAILDLSSVPKPLEALLFAIYSAAVVSLKNHDCERRFGESRKNLLLRYRSATKAALSRANFTGSANLVVLQALLIHLFSMLEVYDSRTLWTLSGVAVRIAEGMGLHRDGSHLKLPPFETEIRRRIWWQLKLFDGDSAELSGSDKKFRTFASGPKAPMLPSNINDDELYPGLSSPPVAPDRATDMVYCALRYDLRSYWAINSVKQREKGRDELFWDDNWSTGAMNEKDKAVDNFERYLETKYVRYCDPSQPIQLMATLLARTAVSTTRLIAHHPRRWGSEEQVPESERLYVWNMSMKALKLFNMIHSSRELERFSWHAAFYFRWLAFIHILDTIRVHPMMSEAIQAWQLIDEAYENNPEFVTNTKKALYVAVGNLCLKAYGAREAALATEGKPVPPTPSYIKTFRRQRDAASARRKNRDATIKSAQHPAGGPLQEQTRNQPDLGQSLSPQIKVMNRPELPVGSSAVWSSGRNEEQSNGLFAFTDDNANMDLDILLGSDTFMEDASKETIDWAQWDALISDFN